MSAGPAFRVLVPSYRRGASLVPTAGYLPWAEVVVGSAEADQYRATGHRVVECPDAVNGNIARVRNWILDTQMGESDGLVMMDDDCLYLARWRGRNAVKITADGVGEMIEAGFLLARDLGAHLWGINLVNDKGAYREYTPLSTTATVLGTFCGHRPDALRYDERFPLKEDYDFFLQSLRAHRRVLRLNHTFYMVRHNVQVGGCAAYRTIERERAQFALLQRKWGTTIVRRDEGADKAMVRGAHRAKGWDLNPRLHVPIPGV